MPLEILSGWKDIARYLGKGARTVQRYERELALPIRRPARKSRGSVIATVDELDAWATASPIREQFRSTHPALKTDTMEQLRSNVQEMSRLRKESEQVRHALRESVEVLRANIGFAMRDTLSDPGLARRIRANVLTSDSKIH